MDSLIYLDRWCPSLPYYFEIIVIDGVVILIVVVMNR